MKDIYARSPFGEVQGLGMLGERNPLGKFMAFFWPIPKDPRIVPSPPWISADLGRFAIASPCHTR